MNENPEGTPNPLNPNPGESEAGAPVEQPTPTEQPVAPQTPQAQVVAEPAANVEPVHGGQSVVVDKPKKKTGLVVAIILFIVAIAGGVAAAIIALNPFGAKKDAFPAALEKLMGGNAPKLVITEGDIKYSFTSDDSLVTSLNVNLQAGANANTLENYASAKVTATLKGGTDLSFNVDEVGTSEKNLYLKLSNIADAIDSYQPTDNTNCIEYGEENCIEPSVIDCDIDEEDCGYTEESYIAEMILGYASVLEVIDGEWIRIPMSDLGSMTNNASTSKSSQCLTDALTNMDEYGKEIGAIYNANPFINYTTENLKVAQKKNTLYQLTLDAEKLAGFINSMRDSAFVNKITACTGAHKSNTDITAEQVSQIVDNMPETYVEIDGNYNFTRLYINAPYQSYGFNMIIDLALSYPSSITIQEPEDYISLTEAISRITGQFMNQEDDDDIFDL